MIVSDSKPEREPAPIGALFEAAFRRYGARISSYTLYSIGFGLIPVTLVLVLRPSASQPIGLATVSSIVGAIVLAHLLLVGTLTALVTGTFRARIAQFALASVVGAVIIGALFSLVGPFAALVYPPLVFAPIAAAAGDASALGGITTGVRLGFGDWGRAYGALFGLGLCLLFIWLAFQVSLTPVNGDARVVIVAALTTIIMSPIAALVERNLYGDITGRTVLPASVSRMQEERGKGPRRRRRGGGG